MNIVSQSLSHMNLLQTARELERYTLLAADGEIGSVESFYFDNATWAVRYLIVHAGGWLTGRRFLVSPVAIGEANENDQVISIELTRNQIENSPPISTDTRLSRQYEEEYYRYYNWTPYWELDSSSGFTESGKPVEQACPMGDQPGPGQEASYLCCTADVNGYAIAALDGEIGHVEDCIVDTQYWVIRYLEIGTRKWWPGKHVLVNPAWIEKVSNKQKMIGVGLTREAIKSAPGFNPSKIISRNYEIQLFKHYGRSAYWNPGGRDKS